VTPVFETPSVTVGVARGMLESRPADVWAVRLEEPGTAGRSFVRVHWGVGGGAFVARRKTGGTQQDSRPVGEGLREAEKALARGWTYVPGTIDFEPMPEPFGSRVRAATWELLDGDAVLLRAAEQRWIAVDLLDGDASFQAQVRACRPFVKGPAVLYILGLERRHRDLCGDYRVIVAPDTHGRFYVGALPDYPYLDAARERERVEAERLAKERERAWQGRY
jgi:hypothetical protein